MTSSFKLEVFIYGRRDKIRTCGPLIPNQIRYQTALLPEIGCAGGARSHDIQINSLALYQLSYRAIINILLALPALYLVAVVCYREPGVVGFEPTNTGVKVPRLNQLGDTPMNQCPNVTQALVYFSAVEF